MKEKMITAKNPVGLDELKKVPLPDGDHRGSYWVGVPFDTWVPLILSKAEEHELGFCAGEVTADLSGGERGGDMVRPLLTMSFRGPAHGDGSRSCLGLLVGPYRTHGYAGVSLPTGEGVVLEDLGEWRHTNRKYQPRRVVVRILLKYRYRLDRMKNSRRALEKAEINKGRADQFLVTAGRNKLLPWSRVGAALDTFAARGRSKWNLLVAFAGAARRSPTADQMSQVYNFYRLIQPEESNREP